MRSRHLQFLVALGFLLAGSALASTPFVMRELEDPYEETRLRVTMHDEGNGQVLVSKCETCPTVTLKILPETQLFLEGEQVPLAQLNALRGRSATVFQIVGTDVVSRIKVQ